MASGDEVRDIFVVWEEWVAEPAPNVVPEIDPEEDPEEDLEEEPEEGPIVDQIVPEAAKANAAQVEEDDQEFDILAEVQTMIALLVDSNRELGSRNQQLEDRKQELVIRNQELEVRVQQTEDRREELKVVWDAEIDTNIRVEGILEGVEANLRRKKRKIFQIVYNFRVSYGRILNRVESHLVELGQTIHTMSRDLVRFLVDQEHRDAIRGGLFM